MHDHGAGDLPAIGQLTKQALMKIHRQFIDVETVEVVANVIVAAAVLAIELTGKRRDNS
jgi:precorrin-4 methylase